MEREGNPSETAMAWQVLKQPRGGAIHNELMFLADASEQLTGSLDPHTILERLARLSVPFLADWCTVDLIERGAADTMGLVGSVPPPVPESDDGPPFAPGVSALDLTPAPGIHAARRQRAAAEAAGSDRAGQAGAAKHKFCRVAARHVNPEREGLLRAISPDAEERLGIAKVLHSGESELLHELDGSQSDEAAERAAALEQLATRSAMAVPLIARGRKLGVLSFGVSESNRVYSADDLVLAAELAHRVALALDNAYLYRKAEEARQSAERSADRAAWLFAVTAALSDAITPPAVLRVLASDVVAAAGGITAMVALRAGLGGELETVRSTGYLEAQIARFKTFDLGAELPLARAVRERQPIFLESEGRFREFDPSFAACCATTGEHAYAAIPLFLEGRVLGAVGFGFSAPQSFTEDDRAFMLALVQQSAQALERARLSALQTEEAMHLSHEVLKQMPEAILVTDVEGNIRYWMGEAESIFGYLSEEIVGKSMSLLHREDLREESTGRILQQIEDARTFVGEVPCVRRDGSEVPIEITAYAVHDQEGRPLFLVGIHRDITDRKRAEEERARLIRVQAARAEAEEAARRFAFLAELSTALAASLDFTATLQSLARLVLPVLADFCLIDIDDGLGLRHVAVAHVSPLKEPLLRYFHPSRVEGEPGPVARVLRTGRSELYADVRGDALLHEAMTSEEAAANRALAPLSYLVVALRARGRILGAISLVSSESGRFFERADVAFAEEVAHRAALALDNARLYREVQDANRLKDEFLGTVSHELRTPLNAILGWARMMQAGSLDRVAETRALSAIERNAEHQVTLIDELLDASQVVTGTLKIERLAVELTLPVQTAVESILPSAAGKGVAIETRLDPEGVFVEGDPARLQQVVWHLLSNAVKFARPGGLVQVQLSQDERFAEIRVSDDGEGITADQLPHVFERFRHEDSSSGRRHGGLGLGLSIVRHVVGLHGGTVRMTSAGPGRGTTCTVQLPLSTGATATALTSAGIAPDPRNPFPRLTGVRVLIADDDPDTLAMLSSVLRRCGAEVSTATSSAEALKLLETSEPALLVVDIGMPGEDGYSLIRKVRDLLPRKVGRTPALALTPYARTEDRVRALAAGYQMHVPKPIEPIELAAAVKSLATGLGAWGRDD
ncbi:GAF domain-containing protein [Sorangium sp. So ce1182]|uniref:hybrid sensor histidine kinase/response regulator n=1 Tax=Sorangium sp. So ce1182 TaxID=3133334 RepID=UPI003F624970